MSAEEIQEQDEQGATTDPELPVVTPPVEPSPSTHNEPDGSMDALLHDVEALVDAHGLTLAALHDALHERIGYRSQ